MKPMKLTDVGPEAAEKYITDPNWIMQQKMDGARVITVVKRTDNDEVLGSRTYQVLFTNDGENEIKFSAAKLKLPDLQTALGFLIADKNVDSMVLDGELIIDTGIYHVFDILELKLSDGVELVRHTMPLEKRLAALGVMLGGYQRPGSELVKISPTARTEFEKRRLWERVNAAGVEGAVSKHLGSLYEPGVRTKSWVKHKLVKTADVVVTAVDRTYDGKGMVTHGSAALAVPIKQFEDPEPYVNVRGGRISSAAFAALPGKKRIAYDYQARELLPVGNASLIGKELTIDVGSVVEIRYLYWTGKAVIQPAILRERFDKLDSECDLAQFPLYTRELAWGGEPA